MRHVHDKNCKGPPICRRVVDLDPLSNTDSYSLVTRKLTRSHEKPRWWPFAMMAWRRCIDFGLLILAAVLLKHCGLVVAP